MRQGIRARHRARWGTGCYEAASGRGLLVGAVAVVALAGVGVASAVAATTPPDVSGNYVFCTNPGPSTDLWVGFWVEGQGGNNGFYELHDGQANTVNSPPPTTPSPGSISCSGSTPAKWPSASSPMERAPTTASRTVLRSITSSRSPWPATAT